MPDVVAEAREHLASLPVTKHRRAEVEAALNSGAWIVTDERGEVLAVRKDDPPPGHPVALVMLGEPVV